MRSSSLLAALSCVSGLVAGLAMMAKILSRAAWARSASISARVRALLMTSGGTAPPRVTRVGLSCVKDGASLPLPFAGPPQPVPVPFPLPFLIPRPRAKGGLWVRQPVGCQEVLSCRDPRNRNLRGVRGAAGSIQLLRQRMQGVYSG